MQFSSDRNQSGSATTRQLFTDIVRGPAPSPKATSSVPFAGRTVTINVKNRNLQQQRRKEQKVGKSKDLLDMAMDSAAAYPPISVPYSTMDDDTKKGQKKKPTMVYIDENNRNAASQLTNDGKLLEDENFIFQLPSVLPYGNVDGESSAPASCQMSRMPDGEIGKLRIYKSGRVELVMGELSFQVDQGSECNFDQQLACVCAEENEIMLLGPAGRRMVVTPNVEQMLAAAHA